MIHQSLIRSAVYCAHPLPDRELLPENRCVDCIDQGEREFTFWLNGGNKKERMDRISREAQYHNEKPMCLSAFPYGEKNETIKGITISENIRLDAFKRSEDENGFIIRVFEPKGQYCEGEIQIESIELTKALSFKPFEIKTLRLNSNKTVECDLIERTL